MSPEPDGKTQPKKKGGGALKWVAVGCLVVLLAAGGCIAGLVMVARGVLTNSEAYKMALNRASQHAEVVEKLGSDLQLNGFMPSGNVNVQNNSGGANLQIPVKGSKGTGVVTVQATLSNGQWTMESLTVTVDGTGEVIDIAGPAEAPQGN